MSNNIFPIPVATPILQDKNNLTMPWMLYLKNIGDDLLQANNIINSASSNNFKYTLNANICFCTYYVTTALATALTIKLPYTAQLAFDINGVIYAPNTKEITIPANVAYTHFWYTVNASTN